MADNTSSRFVSDLLPGSETVALKRRPLGARHGFWLVIGSKIPKNQNSGPPDAAEVRHLKASLEFAESELAHAFSH